eukprot:s736_g11.t1
MPRITRIQQFSATAAFSKSFRCAENAAAHVYHGAFGGGLCFRGTFAYTACHQAGLQTWAHDTGSPGERCFVSARGGSHSLCRSLGKEALNRSRVSDQEEGFRAALRS